MERVPGLFDGLIGVLTFQVFVTPAVLVVVYFAGALFGPWATWRLLRYLGRNIVEASTAAETRRAAVDALHDSAYLSGWRLWLAGIVVLLLLELGWRMLFEFLIAFFDMHDALIAIRNQG